MRPVRALARLTAPAGSRVGVETLGGAFPDVYGEVSNPSIHDFITSTAGL